MAALVFFQGSKLLHRLLDCEKSSQLVIGQLNTRGFKISMGFFTVCMIKAMLCKNERCAYMLYSLVLYHPLMASSISFPSHGKLHQIATDKRPFLQVGDTHVVLSFVSCHPLVASSMPVSQPLPES